MAKQGRGSRVKGATFERWLAKYMTEHTDFTAKRGIGQTRCGGAEVSDVDMPIIHIEAKRQVRCHIKAAMKQAINDSNVNGKIPVAITKDDKQDVLCTMLLDDWVKLFDAYAKSLNKE